MFQDIVCSFGFVVESSDFHDDVGTKTVFHQVGWEQRCHVILVLQIKFLDGTDRANDGLM